LFNPTSWIRRQCHEARRWIASATTLEIRTRGGSGSEKNPVLSVLSFVAKVPLLQYLNPFLGLLNNCRNAMLYGLPPDFAMFFYDLAFGFILLSFAWWLFRKTEYLILEKT
jgi:hypothetical protein